MARTTPIRLTPLRRHLAAVITIALSCAFVAVMVVAGNLLTQALSSQTTQTYAGTDLVITTGVDEEDLAAGQPLPAPEVEGATDVRPQIQGFVAMSGPDGDRELFLDAVALTEDPTLVEGTLPSSADEVVLDATAAEQLDAAVGDTVTVGADFSMTGERTEYEVVGIAPGAEGSVFGATARVMVSPENAASLLGPFEGTDSGSWFADVAAGEDPAVVAAAAADRDDLTVRTSEEVVDEDVQKLTGSSIVLLMMLGVFVVIALFTSAVVIANTFAVTVAQRTRSLALLRTLGATRAQVRRVVLRESMLVGLLGAGIGVLAGHLLVQAALAAAAGIGWLDGLALVPISPLSVLLPILAGVLITLLASLAPMRAATRVAPLEALRPAEAAVRGRGPGARGVIGIVLFALGVALLGGGTALSLAGQGAVGILAGMAGGVLSFSGLLLGLRLVTTPLVRGIGSLLGRLGGLPARVARTNVGRNPRRSAATIGALLIGTTLMTMMAVGARTAEVSLTSELDSRRPIDLVISAEAMPEGAAEQVAAVPGVATALPTERAEVEVGARDTMTTYAVTPEAMREVSHRPEAADLLEDGVVLIGAERAGLFGLTGGETITVDGADGSPVQLEVVIDANLQMSLVTPATLEDLAGDATEPVVLADHADPGTSAREGVDAGALYLDVSAVTAQEGWEEPTIQAGGMEREAYGQILDVLLGITLGLLAVAVLVALVGVANTLSLSVVERTRENALLRALGTTRRQMRAMLGWEGVLLALVGAVLGIVLGAVYGMLGITAILGADFPVTISLPWGQLGIVLVTAILAGALASVIPGRAAARTAPAAALAGGE